MGLTKWRIGKTENGYGEEGLLLKGEKDFDDGRILSVRKDGNYFIFSEECDACFSVTYIKEEALQAIEELKQWIIEQ